VLVRDAAVSAVQPRLEVGDRSVRLRQQPLTCWGGALRSVVVGVAPASSGHGVIAPSDLEVIDLDRSDQQIAIGCDHGATQLPQRRDSCVERR